MCVIEFLLRYLISHEQEKLFLRKYGVGIWMRTEIAFLQSFYILAHLVAAPKIQYMVSL